MMKQLNCLNKRKLELGKWKVAGARFLYGVMFADFFFRPRFHREMQSTGIYNVRARARNKNVFIPIDTD